MFGSIGSISLTEYVCCNSSDFSTTPATNILELSERTVGRTEIIFTVFTENWNLE